MKKSIWFTAGILCGVMVLMAGCSIGGKKPPTVMLDGSYQLVLGKSNIKEIRDAGFTNRLIYTAKDVIKPKSWNDFYAVKDDISYGDMMAGNKSSKDIPLDEGVVFEISLDYIDPDHEVGEVTVDGVDYRGYTRDQIKEAMGDAVPYSDSEEYLTYKSKSIRYTFGFKDGSETLTGLRINDGTEIKYVME